MAMTLDTRDFDQAVRRMSELSKREPAVIVRNMARDYTREVLNATPIAKKTWWKRIERNDGQVIWVRKDKETRPRGTGFAKAGWVKSRVWATISKVNYFASSQEQYAEKYSGLDDQLKEFFASITLENRVPYIGDLDQRENIEGRGIDKAMVMLQKGIAKFEKKLQEANK
jgi:hypothetical protein